MILTAYEIGLVTGRINGNKDHKTKVIKKLNDFQQAVTDPAYIAAVNALIPQAEEVARSMTQGWAGRHNHVCWDQVFHAEMNRLKRQLNQRENV